MRRTLAPIALALALACTSSEPVDPPQAPAVEAGATHRVDPATAATPTKARVGDAIELELPGPSQGIAPEYRFGWGTPKVTGGAIELVQRRDEGPPPDVDGGGTRVIFELRATTVGRGRIDVPVIHRGADAAAQPVSHLVIVSE